MTDWSTLHDAYGSAERIPALLARLSPEGSDPTWEELWSRLCHQGTVYPASYEALPALASIGAQWPPQQRQMLLVLASSIVASEDRQAGADAERLHAHDAAIATLSELTAATIAVRGWTTTEFVYLLQGARAFVGDRVWGYQLEVLVSGEARAQCPVCDVSLFVVVGPYGCFIAAQEWVNRPEAQRAPIVPAQTTLSEPGSWIVQQAMTAEQRQVAEWTTYLFGTSRCPACSASLSVAQLLTDSR